MTSEFWNLNRKRAFTTAILAHARGTRAEPVPMECASRSNVMGAVLHALGYETRRIALFDTDTENLKGHTFLEVLNPLTGQWESQDPLYDIYWIKKGTSARASVLTTTITGPSAARAEMRSTTRQPPPPSPMIPMCLLSTVYRPRRFRSIFGYFIVVFCRNDRES